VAAEFGGGIPSAAKLVKFAKNPLVSAPTLAVIDGVCYLVAIVCYAGAA
jgi:hypothetical protein